ncbi:transglycosylase SLT domain-containing protein [Amycolatopsis albispora]|uniref:Transglycosylase SLT domain-containing protein n=1 Tax=Amycolatopsis albispora TaxID=1804986 RepID=A0A344LIT0_9PSEU|nr:transglycosylase SLT domain-containing protein [Amycolatopsis albispora]AXB47954.1 hypothetical protein A4R43_40505 [Amycolatopsis albispora]
MLNYENLYHAPVHALEQAVDDWSRVIGKVEALGSELADTVTQPLKASGWKGPAAQTAMSFLGETSKEFGDAAKQARGIRDLLEEAHGRIKRNQDALYRITDHEAPAKGLKVDQKGEVTANPPVDPQDRSTWRGKDDIRDAIEEGRHAIEAIKTRINQVLRDASEADETAAWALRANLGGEKHDFNQPQHTSLAGAWNAGAWKNSVTGNGSFLDPHGKDIVAAANKYGINPKVLAALLIQEGEGRSLGTKIPFDLFRHAESKGLVGNSVGLGQMQAGTAAELMAKYHGEKVSQDDIRDRLAHDDRLAIDLAAANLHHLKSTYGISDEQAYTAYAADDKLIRAWLRDDTNYPNYGNMTERSDSFAKRYREANDVGGLVR